jgi:glycosyltransferase involved in cell wall biosynthesis
MRVSLNTGAITAKDQNRGIGVYAEQLSRRLPKLVTIDSLRPEIIHSLVFKLFSGKKINTSDSVPTVATVHDLIPLKFPQAYPLGIRGRLKWWRQKSQLRQLAGIITDSQASKQDIVHFTGIKAEKIHVVYLAADEVFKPVKPVNKWALPKKFVLYVGDLNWNKNVVALTKICLRLGYPLVVVGRQAVETDYNHNHPETSELVKFQRLAQKQPKRIVRLGVVPNQDLAAIYSLATVYVQPSRDEGFGLPVVEAMSCGCPVLTSRQGSLAEIVAPESLLFNAANLRQVWNSAELRQRLITAGINQAKKFSWDKTVKATVKVYEKIIAYRSSR